MTNLITREEAFKKVLDKFPSHKAAAKAFGITERTYTNWRVVGFKSRSTAIMAAALLKQKAGVDVDPESLRSNGEDTRHQNKKSSSI